MAIGVLNGQRDKIQSVNKQFPDINGDINLDAVFLNRMGHDGMLGDLNMDNHNVKNLAKPVNGNDAARLVDLNHLAIEDTANPGCFYRMVAGEKEWINPPMVDGEEYKTTKRINKKPVYTLYKTATVGAKGNTIPLGIPSNATIVGSSQMVKIADDVRPLPWNDGGNNMISFLIRSGDAIVYVGATAPKPQNYTVDITVEYTK